MSQELPVPTRRDVAPPARQSLVRRGLRSTGDGLIDVVVETTADVTAGAALNIMGRVVVSAGAHLVRGALALVHVLLHAV